MWWRIEVRKDGGIAACTMAEASARDGGNRVFYIEADDAASAASQAVARYRRYLETQRESMAARRAERKQAGQCRDCGGPIGDVVDHGRGRIRCAACVKRMMDVRRRVIEPGKQGVMTPRVQELKLERAGRSQRATILNEILDAAIAMKAGVRFISWLRAERDAAESGKAVAAE